MWCDEEAGMLGFSTGKFSVILPQGRASPLLLQNIGSGGGREWAELMLERHFGEKRKGWQHFVPCLRFHDGGA